MFMQSGLLTVIPKSKTFSPPASSHPSTSEPEAVKASATAASSAGNSVYSAIHETGNFMLSSKLL